jgi:hypothetical protein
LVASATDNAPSASSMSAACDSFVAGKTPATPAAFTNPCARACLRLAAK